MYSVMTSFRLSIAGFSQPWIFSQSLTVAAPFRAFTLMNDELASRNLRNTRLAYAFDVSADRSELLLNALVAAVHMVDAVDDSLSFGDERSQDEGCARTEI